MIRFCAKNIIEVFFWAIPINNVEEFLFSLASLSSTFNCVTCCTRLWLASHLVTTTHILRRWFRLFQTLLTTSHMLGVLGVLLLKIDVMPGALGVLLLKMTAKHVSDLLKSARQLTSPRYCQSLVKLVLFWTRSVEV